MHGSRWKLGRAALLAAALALTLGLLAATAGASHRESRPPAGLSRYGRIVWNFEGLLRRTLGTTHVCRQLQAPPDWTRKACTHLALADLVPWQAVFQPHTATAYTLSRRPPPKLGNVAPVEIAGRFVRCKSPGRWLVVSGDDLMECT